MSEKTYREDWNMAVSRLKQLSQLVDDVRRHQYRARKHRDHKNTRVYKEMVYNLFFEVDLYLDQRNRSWSKYIDDRHDIESREEIVNSFHSIDNDLETRGLTTQEYSEIIERIEELDNIVNRARMKENLDIPKPQDGENPWEVARKQKQS